MATNINTDIAQEINITARRGDTFELGVSVVGGDNNSLNLTGTQVDTNNLVVTTYQSSEFNPSILSVPIYQAKMTIKKIGSEFDILSVFTFFWKDTVFGNVLPSLTVTGKYRGEDSNAMSSKDKAGIFLQSSAGGSGELINIRIPSAYMNISPGSYIYDFQIRKKLTFDVPYSNEAITDLGATYTTWFKGNFIINNDVTKQ